MAVGLHARQGVPEMGRELPRDERVVGILMSFMGCLLKERCACEWEFLVRIIYIFIHLYSLSLVFVLKVACTVIY